MYNKQYTGVLLVPKSEDTPRWVKWVHEPSGIFHCPESVFGWMVAGSHVKMLQSGLTMKNAIAD